MGTRFLQRIALMSVAILCSACSSILLTGDRYSLYSDNISALRSFDIEPVNVGQFSNPVEIFGNEISQTGHSELRCLANAYVAPPDDQTFGDFIRSSLIFELTNANLYGTDSQIVLTGDIQEVNFSFDRTIGLASFGGTWSYKVSVQSSNNHILSVSSSYSYETPYQASSCAEMADSLMPSIQNLINDILVDDEFPALVSTN